MRDRNLRKITRDKRGNALRIGSRRGGEEGEGGGGHMKRDSQKKRLETYK